MSNEIRDGCYWEDTLLVYWQGGRDGIFKRLLIATSPQIAVPLFVTPVRNSIGSSAECPASVYLLLVLSYVVCSSKGPDTDACLLWVTAAPFKSTLHSCTPAEELFLIFSTIQIDEGRPLAQKKASFPLYLSDWFLQTLLKIKIPCQHLWNKSPKWTPY